MKYTYYGDTDFNGDQSTSTTTAAPTLASTTARSGWLNGDFDCNGIVNFDDYALIDLAFNNQSGTLRMAMSYLEGGDPSGARDERAGVAAGARALR